MRSRLTLLIILLLLLPMLALSQKEEPVLSNYKTLFAKRKAWIDHCDKFLGNGNGLLEDYPGMIQAGYKGLKLFKDDSSISYFSFYVAVGYEFSGISNDSALLYYRLSEKHGNSARAPVRVLNAQKQLIGLGTDEEREAIATRMLRMHDTTRDQDTKLDILSALYKFYRDKNQYEKAIAYNIESLQIRKQLYKKRGQKEDANNFINIGVELLQIGDMYYRMGQLDKALEYLREATAYTGKHYMDGASLLYNNMLAIFLDQGELDSANKYYQKINELKQDGYNSKAGFSHANRSYADYYMKHKDLDKALEYGKKAYALSMEDGGDVTIFQSNTVMGNIYFERKEYQNALTHLLAVPVEARDFDKETYNALQLIKAECYRALGDFQKASEFYRDYAFTKDTLLNEAGKKNIAEMEARFQNKQKQQQIDEAKKERIYLISGIVALLAILLLLYVNYVNKKRNARILDAKNAALYEANKTKATLFSVISHDLRSPISQLYQYLQLQKDNPELLSEEMKRKHSERISNATASLLETMEDMLVWSKTQMDRFVPAIEDVPVHLLIQDTISLLGPDIAAKALNVRNEIGHDTIVHSDTNLLKIILRNLLLNAIQYSTKDSTIEITAIQAESGTTIAIKDEGLGMSDEVIESLQKGDQNLSSNRKGLGWALINEMAGSIGASIDIRRNVPKGTIVSLSIGTGKA